MTDGGMPIEETQIPAPTAAPEAPQVRRYWLSSRVRPLTLSEGNVFLLLSVIIGLFSGMAVVCFRITIEWVRLSLLGSALAPSHLRVLLVPAGAGLVVARLPVRDRQGNCEGAGTE